LPRFDRRNRRRRPRRAATTSAAHQQQRETDHPLAPRITATIGSPEFDNPRGIAVQFRYAFVVDRYGLKRLDVTDLARPKLLEKGKVALGDPRNECVARTYAYVADGRFGLSLVDVENPEQPRYNQEYNANGVINDTNDVKIGMVAGSAFAFVADARNGLRVLQIVSPRDDPEHFSGFSPRPTPKLIPTARTSGPALAISKASTATAPSTNPVANSPCSAAAAPVPQNRAEMQRLYQHSTNGGFYAVTDEPAESSPSATSSFSRSFFARARNWLHSLY
jgi:hypothetical protein